MKVSGSFSVRLTLSVAAVFVVSCTGPAGKDGTNGTNGADGARGADGVSGLVTVSNEAAGANCATGGQRIDSGIDNGDGGGTAGNGVLEAGEIDSTAYVCNGGDGATALLATTAEPAGTNCPNGGRRVDSGLDNGDGGGTADNGTLEAGEIDATTYVCNGASLLVVSRTEAAGANCAAGGMRIDSGLDNGDGGGTAGNGTLESGEVDATAYVCDGAAGVTSLVNVVAEPAGMNCVAGGVRVDTGLDNGDGGETAGDGVLGAGEVDASSFVCNGSDGAAGVGSLLTVTAEPAGANCPFGGQRVDHGLDNGDGNGTAGNGTLEPGEVDGTNYLCTACITGGSVTLNPTGTAGTGTIQNWTVPAGVCQVTITASGAQGAVSQALGARMRGTFDVRGGTTLRILVGQLGLSGGSQLHGGGGTFVADIFDKPWIVAGGGGSCYITCPADSELVGQAGTASGTAGTTPRSDNGAGGGSANTTAGGGGGMYTDGANAGGGKAFVNGGAGGVGDTTGGFGGGGARTGSFGEGGGGGYSGGSCGDLPGAWVGCGGGGSFNAGLNPLNQAGANTGAGQVVITW